MNCVSLIENLGYRCRSVRALSGEQAFAVDTPFTFPDGTCFGFYVLSAGSHGYLLSDNADVLAHLRGRGFDLADRRRWRPITGFAETFGLELVDTGEVRAIVPAPRLSEMMANFVAFANAVARWEAERDGLHDSTEALVEEVELALRAWRAGTSLTRDAHTRGATGKEYTFHLLVGNELVDAIRPSAQSVSAVLRKILDVQNAGEERSIMVVVDDRDDPTKARGEIGILSQVSRAVALTRLQSNAGESARVH